MTEPRREGSTPFRDYLALLVSLAAGAVAFLPFASDTSPLDTLLLRVPGNQGNWWHALAGAPFFLAFPMIWVRSRFLASKGMLTGTGRRFIWAIVALSICATVAVEAPFLFYLAGTSERQRVTVLCLGFGVILTAGTLLLFRRRSIGATRACSVGLSTAYLANAAIFLVVFSSAGGPLKSRSGWLLTAIIVWPMALEVAWTLTENLAPRSVTLPSRK